MDLVFDLDFIPLNPPRRRMEAGLMRTVVLLAFKAPDSFLGLVHLVEAPPLALGFFK